MSNTQTFSPATEKYFSDLQQEIERTYGTAEIARSKGLDPVDKVEVPLALNMAAKVVRLIATKYPQLDKEIIINRILELEKQYGSLDNCVSFKIAEEIAQEKYCQFTTQLEAIDAGIRVGFAYTTLGVVSSPIEGYTEIKTGKTKLGETYLKAYFSGPIRSAGTTASCVVLMLIDYLRQIFGYARYDPTEEEAKRTVTELYDYHDRITNLQYLPTEEEAYFLARHLPIQVNGEASETKEVSNYKDLSRIETNFIRGGFCLILGEGLAQKAAKGLRILKGLEKNEFKIRDWEWLEEYVQLHEKRNKGKTDLSPTYIKDLVAGRPVFGHPGKGFRFRYGRSRAAGFSAVSVHPAVMGITNDFIATGTQLKVEKPTKGCIVTLCDSIEGPIVKFKNGTVKKMMSYEEAKKAYTDVEEIIYLGDILFPLGDVINRNSVLIKPGYVEEWWKLDLEKAGGNCSDSFMVSFEDALLFSKNFSVPLHPQYIFYWTQLNYPQFLDLVAWFKQAHINEGKLLFNYAPLERAQLGNPKRALELLGVEHSVGVEHVIIEPVIAQSLLVNLGFLPDHSGPFIFPSEFASLELFSEGIEEKTEGKKILQIINSLSSYVIKDKAGEFIGSRMGRPEKAKLRKLTGSPTVLFPVGDEGGRLRSVNEAARVGTVTGDFPFYFCEQCKKESIYRRCETCFNKTTPRYYCKRCAKEISEMCEIHHVKQEFKSGKIDIAHYLEKARQSLHLSKNDLPELIKGIRGTSSENHALEHLVKGVLRAKHKLCVNKDGTVRYDMTEIPLSHFKPLEIGVSVSKLISLGYTHDCYGAALERDEQILELKPHDILLPCNTKAGDERGDDLFISISQFIDELLVKFYGLSPFFSIRNRDELIGHLGVAMAPHNCAGVICRIIGFSKVQGLVASPYLHAAMRRDCDGDEAAVMLLMDVLLNFSRKFLPSHRGGTQDAPLVLNGKIFAREVDDQILDFELVYNYPLELYEKAEEGLHSSEVRIDMVKQRLKSGIDPYVNTGFTHDTVDFNGGCTCSSYKTLPTMKDKVHAQMQLCEKLRSVDQGDVARLIIDRHFMRDLKGNLRKFSQQNFRCSSCNTIYRRPPLQGKCTECGGKIIFTISYGSIVKYLESATELIANYSVPAYIQQDLALTKKYIESIFGKDTEKQISMTHYF